MEVRFQLTRMYNPYSFLRFRIMQNIIHRIYEGIIFASKVQLVTTVTQIVRYHYIYIRNPCHASIIFDLERFRYDETVFLVIITLLLCFYYMFQKFFPKRITCLISLLAILIDRNLLWKALSFGRRCHLQNAVVRKFIFTLYT